MSEPYDKRISDLPILTSLNGGEYIPIIARGENYKVRTDTLGASLSTSSSVSSSGSGISAADKAKLDLLPDNGIQCLHFRARNYESDDTLDVWYNGIKDACVWITSEDDSVTFSADPNTGEVIVSVSDAAPFKTFNDGYQTQIISQGKRGLMSITDKTKLDALPDRATLDEMFANVSTSGRTETVVTTEADGLMSKEMFKTLCSDVIGVSQQAQEVEIVIPTLDKTKNKSAILIGAEPSKNTVGGRAGVMIATDKEKLDALPTAAALQQQLSNLRDNNAGIYRPTLWFSRFVESVGSQEPGDMCPDANFDIVVYDNRLYAYANGIYYFKWSNYELWGAAGTTTGVVPKPNTLYDCYGEKYHYVNSQLVKAPTVLDLARDIDEGLSIIPTPQTSQTGSDSNYIYSSNSVNSQKVLVVRDTGFYHNANNDLYMKLGFWHADDSIERSVNISCPYATPTQAGFMSKDAMAKLNTLPSAETLNEQFDSKLTSVVYDHTNIEVDKRRAVNGIFSLTTDASELDVMAALTEYSSKKILSRSELEYCAEAGIQIFDQETQGFVQVTHNGGGMFNFIELSMKNYGELPRLRFVCIRITDDGVYSLTRPAQQERLVMFSEYTHLANLIIGLEARVVALESAAGNSPSNTTDEA